MCHVCLEHAGYCEHTFAHDLFLGVGLLIQNAELIIAVYEHYASVIPVFHGPFILLQQQWKVLLTLLSHLLFHIDAKDIVGRCLTMKPSRMIVSQ